MWQGRFYSCPLDEPHLWKALRYVELNPVRAKMVEATDTWRWSSAAAHCGLTDPDPILEMERWQKRWTAGAWSQFLADGESATEMRELRHSTHTGRPLGSEEFMAALEELTLRRAHSTERRTTQQKSTRCAPTHYHVGCIGVQKLGYVPSV